MNKQLTIFIFILLILSSLAYAVPPSRIVDSSPNGLIIKAPLYNTIGVGKEFDFNIHLFNASNGVPLSNTSINCILHFYDLAGNHIYGEYMEHDPVTEHYINNEWVSRLNSSIFPTRGEYNFLVQCNSSTLGGFYGSNLGVMDNTFDVSNDSSTGLAITIFMISIILGLLYLGISNYRIFNMEWTNLLLKRCAIVVSIWLMTYTSAMMASLALSSNLNMTKSIFMYMNLFGWAGYIAMSYLVLKTLFDTLTLWKINKDNKRMGEND